MRGKVPRLEVCRMLTAFFAVFPVFLIIGFGVFLRARDILPDQTGSILGLYVLKLALPLLLLHVMAQADRNTLNHAGFWAGAIGAPVACYLLGYVTDRLLCRRGTGPAVTSALGCSASNTAFVGLPIVESLLPGNTEALVVAGLMTLTPNVVMIMGQVRFDLLSKSGEAGRDGKRSGRICFLLRTLILGNPILMSTVLGLLLALSGVGLWQPLDRAFSLVGFTAAPCMLVALGLDLGEKLRLALGRGRGHTLLWQTWIVSCKLLLCPLICWGIMSALSVEPLWLGVAVLTSGTGTALMATVLAQVYAAVPEESALTAVLSNGISMLTLTGIIWILQGMGCL